MLRNRHRNKYDYPTEFRVTCDGSPPKITPIHKFSEIVGPLFLRTFEGKVQLAPDTEIVPKLVLLEQQIVVQMRILM